MVTRSFNDLKQKTEESYFDTDENPVLIDKGYAVIRFEYDEAGNVVCERYYDDSKGSDGSEKPEPIALASGAHMVTRSFNDLKQKTEERYFDTDENPVLIDKGYAVIRFEYDEAGNVVCERYYDDSKGSDGSEKPEPIALASGAHMVTRSFNDLKQKTEESYFDTDENPVLIDKGYAVIRFEYDEAGNVVCERYYDDSKGSDGSEKPEPIALASGAHMVTRSFNDLKQKTEERYFDTDENPVLIDKGYAVIRFEYDEAGNVVCERYYDDSKGSDGSEEPEPIALASGAHMVTRSFNDLKQKTEESYFDTEENPVLIDKGYAVIRFEYDEAGNVVCERYYDDSKGRTGRKSLNQSPWHPARTW